MSVGVPVVNERFIGASRVASLDSFEDCSAIDGEPVTDIAHDSTHEGYLAISAAAKAFRARSELAAKDRGGYVLYCIAHLIQARRKVLGAAAADNGALLAWQRRTVVARVVQSLRFFAACLGKYLSIPALDTRGHRDHRSCDSAGISVPISP